MTSANEWQVWKQGEVAFSFAVLWLPLQARKTLPSAPKIEVLGEYMAFRVVSGVSPSAPQSHSRCLWGIKQEKEWTCSCGKLEVKRWATAMGKDYIIVPFWGKHWGWIWFFSALSTGLKKVMGERKNVRGTHRAHSCSTKRASQFLSPHIDFMIIGAVSICHRRPDQRP